MVSYPSCKRMWVANWSLFFMVYSKKGVAIGQPNDIVRIERRIALSCFKYVKPSNWVPCLVDVLGNFSKLVIFFEFRRFIHTVPVFKSDLCV